MSNVDLDAAKEIELTNIKKYWRYARQVEIELDQQYDQILILATFMKHLHRVYNNKNVTNNMNAKRDIDLE